MTQSAVAYTEQTNGLSALSSGLRTHKGLLEATSIRVRGPLVFPRGGAGGGQGLEMAHNTDVGSLLQAYDREKAAWLDFTVNAKNINLAPQGGKVALPAGSAQQLLGSFRQVVSYSIPAAGNWYETPAQVSATTTGGLVRLEACGSLTHTVVNAVIYVGFMTDGGLTADSVTAASPGVANGVLPYSIVYYSTPSAALHRFSICLYTNITGGGFWNGAYQHLFVTEQRA